MSCLIGLVMFAYYQKYPMSTQQSQAAPDQVRRPPWPLPMPARGQPGLLSRVSGWLQKGLPPWMGEGYKALSTLRFQHVRPQHMALLISAHPA
jgi:hypothetical protein